ncbi:hypothetical protein EDB83DRAFT_2312377 [Lactarius deliciosus]|nr:hypothetical protein EDB83DRAFT_2312377 [Lactarius deliciosus]
MAPVIKYLCPCFKCSSKKELTERTIKIHLKENLTHLNHLRASGAHQSSVDFVQNCYNQISQLLNSLAEGSRSSRWSGYPYPDNLADASVAPPSFLEGGSRDNDAMMVDDDDASFPSGLQERDPMDVEDQDNVNYRFDQDDDSSVIFDIPEEPFGGADSDSDASQMGGDDDDGSLEPNDSALYVGNDTLPDAVIQLQNQLLNGYTLPPCPTAAPS